MKTKTKILKNFKSPLFCLRFFLFLIGLQVMCVGIAWVWQLSQIQTVQAAVSYTAKRPIEMTDKEYVLGEVRKAGLNPDEVDCIIAHESGWDKNAWNSNTNGSIDLCLWQLNSVHYDSKYPITPAEACDVVKATRYAIEKRLRDKSWDAWVGAKQCK
jgi:hypothetical protein